MSLLRSSIVLAVLVMLLAPGSTQAQDSFEPDNTTGQARSVSFSCAEANPGQVRSIDPSGDVDFVRFNAVAGRTYVIETFDALGINTQITLYDQDQTTVRAEVNGNVAGQVNASLVWTALFSGTYYVRIRDGSFNHNQTGTYKVRFLADTDSGYTCWDSNAEPDNTLYQAVAAAFNCSSVDTPIARSITGPQDRDFFRFDAIAGRTYVIETYDVQGFNSSIVLYDRDKTSELASENANINGYVDTRLVFTALFTGRYYLRVRDGSFNHDQTGTYKVRFLADTASGYACWDDDKEPDNTAHQAVALPVNCSTAQAPLVRSIEEVQDMDYWWFDATTEKTYVFETFDVQGFDTEIAVYDDEFQVLASEARNINNTTDTRLTFRPVFSGRYYLRVRDSSFNHDQTGTYSLRALPEFTVQECHAEDAEPNNTAHQAALKEISQTYTHTLGTDDVDFYRFNFVEGHEYAIEVRNPVGVDPEVRLYERNRETSITSARGNGTGATYSRITWNCPITGTYFVRVVDNGNDQAGSYQLRVLDTGATVFPCDCADPDGDGVPDPWDNCPSTAAGSFVDPTGCPGSRVPVEHWSVAGSVTLLLALAGMLMRARVKRMP